MKTRAPSADGASLGHHAEPTLGENLLRERSGSAVQSQPGANPGGGGVGLITDVVASSTSADQLRTRLGERMSWVADLGTSFAG